MVTKGNISHRNIKFSKGILSTERIMPDINLKADIYCAREMR